jgi:hypothetical protein
MDTLADYNAWKLKQQENGVGAAQVVLGSVNETPDQAANDLNLASEFGKATGKPVPPAPLVKEYRNIFQQKVEEAQTKTVLSSAPILTQWLRNPENAAVARDDLDNLSWWDRLGRNVIEVPKGVPGGAVASVGTAMEGAGQLLRPANPAARTALATAISQAQAMKPEDVTALRTRIFGQGDINPQFAQSVLSDVLSGNMTPADAMEALSPMIAPALKSASEALQSGGQATQEFGQSILPAEPSMENSLGRQVGSGLGSMLTILGVGLASGGVGAAVFGGIQGAGEATANARQAGADEDTQTIAALYGVFPGLTDAIPVERLLSNPATKAGVAAFLRSVGVQALTEGGQEAVQQIMQNAIAKNLYAPDQHLLDQVIENFSVGGVVGALVDAGRIALEAALPGRFHRMRQSAERAPDNQQKIAEISAQAQASALRQRMPDKFRDFVEAATRNGPAENVFIPADEFVQYFQGLGVDPRALVDELDGVTRDDLDAALAGGGDLKIPTATYAAKIAGSEHDAFLMENMRFDPDEFTAREAAEFNAKAEDAMQEAFEEAERIRLQHEELRSFEQQIYDTMVSRLRAAGRSTDVATTEAMLYPAFYRVMAERSGMTVDEFMARYPLPKVEGELPEGMQLRDVDALNRTLAEARARRSAGFEKRGPSLLEFIDSYGGINDPGGELRAMDAETVKRGRGKKTLRLARKGVVAGVKDMFGGSGGKKHGLDDVAQAAIEAGYLADDPVAVEYRNAVREGRQAPDIVRALLSAIDRELRGSPEYAGAAPAEPEDDLDKIEAYLNGLGVSLDDDDATIRDAIAADQEGRQYGQSGDVRGARGSIQFPGGGVGNGDTVVRLFQSADLSTFLHESGHYFLTVMRDLAEKGEASASADFEAVKAWWRENAGAVAKDAIRVMPDANVTADDVIRALEIGTTGEVLKDAAVDVGMQEQFARGFEEYLMEGKAPNAELRTAFEKFRAWLISVYQRIAGLNVSVSDDLRRVFDRMLASDEEIAKAQEAAGETAPLFPDAESMGLTPDEYAAFLKLRGQAEDDAKAHLLREIMAPIKREQEKWFKDERAKAREEIERQVNAFPYYRALEWMGNRRWLGDGQPEDMPDIRLSKDILVERYGEGVLKTLPRGMQTVYAVEGGADPDDVAGWFGFDSGDQMVRALEKAPPRKEAIEAETDRLMRERHGDALNDGSLEAAALDAVHTDKRGQWIAAELKAVVEIAGTGVGLTAKEARASARQTIARMRVRDAVSAGRFLAAERKAAEEAARLGAMLAREGVWMNAARRRIASKARAAIRQDGTADAVAGQIERANASTGNYNETVGRLIEVKRRQLINHALYMEARKVADEVEKAERYIDRLTSKATRERIAGAGRREGADFDYLGAIDEILERYDFRRMSGRAEARRGALNAFIEGMKAAGRENELAIPERVLADAARKPYKTLPVEELRGVVDSLKNLEHVALRWNKLIDAQRQREFDATVDEIAAAFDANVKKRPPGPVGSKGEAARNAVRQYLDLGLNANTLLREIDGFADLGPAYRNIKSPIDDAMNRLITRKEQAAKDLENLYSVYSKDERRRMGVREHMPELGYGLSKWERIAVALNTGNEGNYSRLTNPDAPRPMTDAQVNAVLATLDERDAKFVQSVWDYLESFRDDIAARERRATGVEPAWVDPRPVEIAGRTLKGGYFPLRYDPRLSSLVRDDETALSAQSLQSGRFGKAQTRNGHLRERSGPSKRAIELDMSVLHRHVNQVIYDLELSEPVANGWRILQNGRIRSAFTDAGKQADFDALEIWLQDVGNGELRSADLVGRTARMLKSNFTAAKLAFNLVTVATQVAGLSQTAVVVGKKDFLRGLKLSLRRGVSDEIAAKSPFMASRQTTFNKDIYDFYTDPKTGPVASRWGDIKREIIGPLSFWLMTKVQWYMADIPTWMAGYEQGLRRFGNDEAKAIAHADAIVKRAQASGLFADRSAIERGSVSRTTRQNDVIRLFTALGSYMFAKFNVAYERSAKAQRIIGQEGLSARSAQEALSWTLDMAFLFALETVIVAGIKGGLPGQGDDDDGKEEGWATFLARETAFSVLRTLPFIRDAAGAAQGFTAGGAYGGIVNDVVRGGKGAADILSAPFIEDGKVKPSDVKAVINATGLATGLPAAQVNRAVDAAWRQSEGEDVSPLEYLLGRKSR